MNPAPGRYVLADGPMPAVVANHESRTMQRRDLLQLMTLGGGVVMASGLAGCAGLGRGAAGPDFYFVQLSDTHWGYQGPANPEAAHTLRRAVAAVNALPRQPDFVFVSGDLTHTTHDPAERRRRLAEFKAIAAGLSLKTMRRFRFEPAEIELLLGQAVVVETSSLDFVHGMSIPDLSRRLDLLPGRLTRLELPAQRGPGRPALRLQPAGLARWRDGGLGGVRPRGGRDAAVCPSLATASGVTPLISGPRRPWQVDPLRRPLLPGLTP